MIIGLNRYQDAARKFAIYPQSGPNLGIDSIRGVVYTALGLAGEVGELADKIKRVLRDDNDVISPGRHSALVSELGDVLWYVAMCAHELGCSLEEVANLNIAKLQYRLDNGTLRGSGDER